MDSNPYQPPSTRAEASASTSSDGPPRGVVRAVWVLRFFILGSLPISTVLFASSPEPGEMLFGAGAMALPALFLLLSWPVFAGRNWARIVTTCGAVFFLVYGGVAILAIVGIMATGEPTAVGAVVLPALAALTLLQAIGISAATAWLWGKAARRWFRKGRTG